VRVRSPRIDELAPRLATRGWRVERQPDDSAHVFDAEPAQIGDVAGAEGLWIHELTLVQSSLEEAFMRLTAGSVEYHAGRSDAQHALEVESAAVPGWGWGASQPGESGQPGQPGESEQPAQPQQPEQPEQNSPAKERVQ
jgi:ABC-2 type transport system ATP-binding protein